MTLVEMTIASAVVLVAMSIFSSTVANVARQRSINRENAIASEAARNVLETMRSMPFQLVYPSYDGDPANDPTGPGSAPGRRFAVAELSPVPDAGDGLVGEVRFPSSVVAGAWQLREDVEEVALGMPRDLDGDHVIDAADHSTDYVRLPIGVELRWMGATGERRLTVHTMLCRIEFD